MPAGRLCRWRLGGIRTYNPEQIMLSAAVHRSSRDVSIMKEKLIFSGGQPRRQAEPGAGPSSLPHTCPGMWAYTFTHGQGHGTDTRGPHVQRRAFTCRRAHPPRALIDS